MVSPRVDVAILGPVSVHGGDGRPLVVPPGRPTVILAALAARVGAVVPVDALAAYLWPDEQPQRPRGAIQTHVTRLRGALGRDVVTAAGDGYRLDLPAAAVDLFRFRELVAAAPPDDPAGELERLDAALALWRGDVLSGVVPDTLEREVGPLIVEELLAATERRNELRLQLGHVDDEFVLSLRRLATAHPWRERLWAQLMLALYRQGRRGEALSAYRDLVGVLRDELGIDPGADVADLHRRIVESDPDLAPDQIPRSVADFVGRENETDALVGGLSADQPWARVGIISGPGGSGKTTLALRVGHALRDAHPHGQLFAELHGSSNPVPPGDVLAGFLRALGVDDADVPLDVDERAALFRSTCAGRRVLVLLDDAHDAAQITPLLPGVEGCSVLVTSRPQLGVVAADVRIDLGHLSEHEALSLLTAIVGSDRVSAEPDAVDVVVRSCQGSPLALRIAGGRLASRPSWPISHLAARLDGAGRLDALEIGDLSVRATLSASVQLLSPTDAVRFRQLAGLPRPGADVEAAAAAWGTGEAESRECLERLVDVRLLDSAAPDRYRWHDLVDDYIRASATAAETAAARRRLIRWHLRTLHHTWPLVRPGASATEHAPWFPDDVDGRRFSSRDEVHAWMHPRWALLTSLGHAGLRAPEQDEVDEAAALLLALVRSAYECCRDLRIEGAARAVLDVPRELGDRTLTARAWHGLALALGDQRRHAEALAAGIRGLEVRRDLGDRYGEVIMLHNMAVWYELDRRYDEAARLFEECADADDVLSAQLRARCRRNLAHVQISLGRHAEAQHNLERAWAETDQLLDVDVHDHASATGHLHTSMGHYAEATAAYERAVELATEIGSTPLRAAALVGTARARRLADANGTAAALEALDLARDHRLADVEADSLVELGHAHANAGDATGAATEWRAALKLYESMLSAAAEDVRDLLAALP